jgi:hypothetical protein
MGAAFSPALSTWASWEEALLGVEAPASGQGSPGEANLLTLTEPAEAAGEITEPALDEPDEAAAWEAPAELTGPVKAWA